MLALELLESSRLINSLKVGVGPPFSAEFPSMEVWNGWAFLTSTVPMSLIGLIIYWLPVLVERTEAPPPIRTREVNLGGLLEVFPYRGIVPSVYFRFTAAGSRKKRAPLRAVSVTITFGAIVWRACEVPLPAATPSTIGGLTDGMMNGMARLIIFFVENFCW